MKHVDSAEPAWETSLTEALSAANIPTLLMVLVHLTGDRHWLSPRFACSQVQGLDDNDSGGLSEAAQHEVLAGARAALLQWKRGVEPALPSPSHELLAQMMRHGIGEDLPEDYGAFIAAGLGLDPAFALDQRDAFDAGPEFNVIIVGAGVAGLCAAIRLQGAGVRYLVIEKNADVGGTWYENRYPGAGVDTPSHIYSYSFAKHDWSMHFALQPEIQGYFEGVADRFGVRPQMRFDTRVESARYDEEARRWTVQVVDDQGRAESLEANVLIGAVGYLNVPKLPAIEGLDSFASPCFHTARWPAALDVRGKRVAIIGNGASAMQVAPAIVDQVGSLTLFQRSKQWAAPFARFHQPIVAGARFLLREVPYYQAWYRQRLAWIFNDRIHATLQIDPRWPHPERSINHRNDRHRAYFTEYVKAELGDRQDLLRSVLPDYPPFGKRMLMDNGWFRTVARENVHLVDAGIAEVTAHAVVTDDGTHHPADILVIATGFDAANMLSSFDIRGRGGRSIRDAWARNGAEAYMGMTVPGFPNFFILSGPNTGLGHGGSIVALLESQVSYVMGILQQALSRCGTHFEIEVRADVHDAFNARVTKAHDRMIWSHKGMNNWYRNAQGRVVLTTPFRNDDNWQMARRADLDDFVLSAAGETRQEARTAAAESTP